MRVDDQWILCGYVLKGVKAIWSQITYGHPCALKFIYFAIKFKISGVILIDEFNIDNLHK